MIRPMGAKFDAMRRLVHTRLIDRLPGIYQSKDERTPAKPLSTLLDVVALELSTLELAIRALDDDHFVERASPEALPLLAELLGARLLTDDVRTNRAIVARSVAARRRRGTPGAFEEVLALASGFGVEVHEAFRSLAFTQDVRRVNGHRGKLVEIGSPLLFADPRIESAHDGLELAARSSADAMLAQIGYVEPMRSPPLARTVDLRGWARPDVLLVRSSRFVQVALHRIPCVSETLASGARLVDLDPLGRPMPLTWLAPAEPRACRASLGLRYETEAATVAPARRNAVILTPTTLAADPDGIEADGLLELCIDGVPILGTRPSEVPSKDFLSWKLFVPRHVLRFVDTGRPGPGDEFILNLHPIVWDYAGGHIVDKNDDPDAARYVGLEIERKQGRGAELKLSRSNGIVTAHPWLPLENTSLGRPVSGPAPIVAANQARVARLEVTANGVKLVLVTLDATPKAVPLDVQLSLDLRHAVLVGAEDSTLLALLSNGDGLLACRIRIAEEGGKTSAEVTHMEGAGPKLDDLAAIMSPDQQRLFVVGVSAERPESRQIWTVDIQSGKWYPLPALPPSNAVHWAEMRDATLLWARGGLVLIGGRSGEGHLLREVWHLKPGDKAPRWRALPTLPIEAGLPGTLVAQGRNEDIEILIWADRTRPRWMTLAVDAEFFTELREAQTRAPNPPAKDDVLFIGDRLLVLGPSPLPPSEVLITLGDKVYVAHLPAMDMPTGDRWVFSVREDGSTELVLRTHDGVVYERVPDAARLSRAGGAPRIFVTERLAAHPYVLRQRCFGAWDTPEFANDNREEEHMIGLDPRHGRLLLPPGVPTGEISARFAVARGSELGAGCLPVDHCPRAYWEGPPLEPFPPPAPLEATVYIQPNGAGDVQPQGLRDVPVFESIARALENPDERAVVRILAGPPHPPANLVLPHPLGASLLADERAHVPFVQAVAGRSLHFAVPGGGTAEARIDLAGIWIAGSVEFAMVRGRIDIRYCTLGTPSARSLVVGRGARRVGALTSSFEQTLDIWLIGCIVGTIEVPPWVRLYCAGCTFDAGSDDKIAIQAAGSPVHLRHVTVRGKTVADVLQASSCAFSGEVTAIRTQKSLVQYSILPPDNSRFAQRNVLQRASFASVHPTDPRYLVLSQIHGPEALLAGEHGRQPGAHAEQSDRRRELEERAAMALPIGLSAYHLDRTAVDLARMGSRTL